MMTMDFTSRMLHRALQALALIVALFAAFLVLALATSALADDGEDFTAEVIRLVNVERSKVGIAPLEEQTDMIPAANLRAQETSVKFSHTRPNGSKWKTVFDEYEIAYTYRGENLAKGQRTPATVVKAWMASEGHRKNILNAEFDHIAVGLYKKNGVMYWSQLFVRTPSTQTLTASAPVVEITGKPAAAGQYAQVTGLDLNVRAAATTKSNVLAVATEGSTVDVLEVYGNWARVRMADGTEGWASMKYLIA